METDDADVLDLRDYLEVLRRRWLLVVMTVLVTVALALSVSALQTPVYEGRAELAIEPVRSSGDAALEDLILGDSVVATEQRVITSRPVTLRVIEALGLGDDVDPSKVVDDVRVSVVSDTRVVEIVANDTDPESAAALANGYANAYLEHRRDRAIDEVTAARANLDERAEELRSELSRLGDEDTGQRESLVQQLGQVEAQLATLDPDAEAVRGGGEVLVPAEAATGPVSPRPLRTGALALVLGAMLGVGLAFLRDHFDDAVRSDEDVRRIGGGHPVLGRIMHWTDTRADRRLITLLDPHDIASEEYRALSANVRFALIRYARTDPAGSGSSPSFRQQSILVTSANPGEGKSTTAANLAVAAAMSGQRVILVESDLRQPTLSGRFGIPEGWGLSNLLVDAASLTSTDRLVEHLIDVGVPRLRVLPAGTVPPNPNELLASPAMRWLHRSLVRIADLVVYDTPPLLPVADTLEVSQLVDATAIVVRVGTSHRRELQHAVERLEGVGGEVGGFVVNDLAPTKRSAYGYGYRQRAYAPRGGGATPSPAAEDWSFAMPAPTVGGDEDLAPPAPTEVVETSLRADSGHGGGPAGTSSARPAGQVEQNWG